MSENKRNSDDGAGASVSKSEQLNDWSDEFPTTPQEKASAAAETQKSDAAVKTREKLDPEKAGAGSELRPKDR